MFLRGTNAGAGQREFARFRRERHRRRGRSARAAASDHGRAARGNEVRSGRGAVDIRGGGLRAETRTRAGFCARLHRVRPLARDSPPATSAATSLPAEDEAPHMFAWAEAVAPKLGWVAFDAVHDLCPNASYVRVAVGLDATGAAPFRGSHSGADETVTAALRIEQAVGRGSVSNRPTTARSPASEKFALYDFLIRVRRLRYGALTASPLWLGVGTALSSQRSSCSGMVRALASARGR